MLAKLLPIILIAVGTGAGLGAGLFLRPAPDPEIAKEMGAEGDAKADPSKEAGAKPKKDDAEDLTAQREYVKLANQFVIPLVQSGRVDGLVVMSLSVEVEPGNRDAIFAREPKLRDSFLQVMFDHANIGGFRGSFTNASNLEVLRTGLRQVAVRDAGEFVTDVLILEIARQDV